MKTFVTAVLLTLMGWAQAKETIAIQSPYSASHSGTPAMLRIVDEANRAQDRYRFTLEFRPGGEQILAIKALDEQPQSRLAIIAPKFVEHAEAGRLTASDYLPVHALGDACWAVIANLGDERVGVASLRGQKEITVGGVGFGNAAHLTSLQLAEQFGFRVTYVPFKSNFDALVLMAGDNSINMVIDRVASFQQFRDRNPRMRILAMSCPSRHPDLPQIRTLQEQGVVAPYVFNITMAHRTMDATRRQDIGQILQAATERVGLAEIQRLSDMTPPVFDRRDLQAYTDQSLRLVRSLLNKHRQHLPN